MKKEHNFSEIPYNYPLCLNCQCPKASTCLRLLAELDISDDIEFLVIINPKYQATLGDNCPHYRSSTKVRYAKGFMNILEKLPYKQIKPVTSLLINQFSQRTYYRIRKGERLLSPHEQKSILEILKKCGVTGIQEFDAYVEDYEW